jgi:hypothetical protein
MQSCWNDVYFSIEAFVHSEGCAKKGNVRHEHDTVVARDDQRRCPAACRASSFDDLRFAFIAPQVVWRPFDYGSLREPTLRVTALERQNGISSSRAASSSANVVVAPLLPFERAGAELRS